MDLSNRSQEKIDSIKRAAKQLFDQHGFNKVTMDSIVKQSKVSKGTVYKYFSDKTVLYESIVKDIYNQERDDYNTILQNDDSFVEKVSQIVSRKVDKYKGTNQKFFEDHYVQSKPFQNYLEEYTCDIAMLRNKLYQIGRNEGYISKTIENRTLELYFEIIQAGLSQRYNELIMMPKEELTRVLKMIYSGMIREKEKVG